MESDAVHIENKPVEPQGMVLCARCALMGNSPEICRRHYAALIPETMADSVEFRSSDARGNTASGRGFVAK